MTRICTDDQLYSTHTKVGEIPTQQEVLVPRQRVLRKPHNFPELQRYL